jgi:polar amino acid transport system substrate-binding protein
MGYPRIEVVHYGRVRLEKTVSSVVSGDGPRVSREPSARPSARDGDPPRRAFIGTIARVRLEIGSIARVIPRFCRSSSARTAPRPEHRLRWALFLYFMLLGLLPAAIGPAVAQSAAQPHQRLIVATKEAPPFAMRSENGTWTGISIDLWNRIGQKLGFYTTFREYQTVPEMLAAVASGGADAAVAAISVTPEREKTVDFTQPFYDSGLSIAVPASKEIEWIFILRNVFTFRFLEAIGVLIAGAMIVGSAIWLIERRVTEHYANGAQGFGTGLWWSASAMAQAAAADKAPATLWGRLLGMLWMITSIVAVASFTAGITSHLAARRFAQVVRTSSDLAAIRTGSVPSTNAFDYLRSQRIDARSYPSIAAGLDALRAGKLDAFVYDRPILEWNVHKGYIDDVQVLDKLFVRDNYAIALPKGSALRIEIDVAMGEEMRDVWWQDLLVQYLGSGE